MLLEFYQFLLDMGLYLLISALFTCYFYYYKRKDLVGGFIGGFFVSLIGAIIITMFASFRDWFSKVVVWLLSPHLFGEFYFRVNLLTAAIGAFLFLFILNHINHDRDRS